MWPQQASGQPVGLVLEEGEFDPNLPSLLCLHGSGGRAREFGPLLRGLAGRCNPAALDLPGHGDTPGPGCQRVEDYAAWLAAYLEAGAVRPVLLGHSLGGAIGLTLALQRPELLRGLILEGSGARLRVMPAILEGLAQDFASTVKLVASAVMAPEAPQDLKAKFEQDLGRTSPQVILGDFTACDRFDLMERLGQVALPCLVLVGDQDRLTPLKYGRFLAEGIPGANLLVIEGAGHMLHWEKPEQTGQIVASFLAQLAG